VPVTSESLDGPTPAPSAVSRFSAQGLIGAPALGLATVLRARIESGEITARLPDERALQQELAVGTVTIHKAVRLLRDEGLVRRAAGEQLCDQELRLAHLAASDRYSMGLHVIQGFRRPAGVPGRVLVIALHSSPGDSSQVATASEACSYLSAELAPESAPSSPASESSLVSKSPGSPTTAYICPQTARRALSLLSRFPSASASSVGHP